MEKEELKPSAKGIWVNDKPIEEVIEQQETDDIMVVMGRTIASSGRMVKRPVITKKQEKFKQKRIGKVRYERVYLVEEDQMKGMPSGKTKLVSMKILSYLSAQPQSHGFPTNQLLDDAGISKTDFATGYGACASMVKRGVLLSAKGEGNRKILRLNPSLGELTKDRLTSAFEGASNIGSVCKKLVGKKIKAVVPKVRAVSPKEQAEVHRPRLMESADEVLGGSTTQLAKIIKGGGKVAPKNKADLRDLIDLMILKKLSDMMED